jgi:hypothetical protein
MIEKTFKFTVKRKETQQLRRTWIKVFEVEAKDEFTAKLMAPQCGKIVFASDVTEHDSEDIFWTVEPCEDNKDA